MKNINLAHHKTIVGGIMLLGCLLSISGCASGDTPTARRSNAEHETAQALTQIYQAHPVAKADVANSLGYLVCTGTDNYLFAAASGAGICTLHSKGKLEYYRFASIGAGIGIGFKKVSFLYTFHDAEALRRLREEGWDAGARAEASAKHEQNGGQIASNTSYDVNGVNVYQAVVWGAAAQATVQGYKFWPTDFSHDVM